MGSLLRVEGLRGGATVALPDDLDAIAVSTSAGTIRIDLIAPIEDMVLLSAGSRERGETPTRLILSPMASGRLAVGVIRCL